MNFYYLFFTVFTVVLGLPIVIFLARKDKLEEIKQEQTEPLLTNWEQKVLLAKVYKDVEEYRPLLQDLCFNYQKPLKPPKEMSNLADGKITVEDISPIKRFFPEDILPSTPWTSKDFWKQKEPQEKKEERVDKSDEKE